MQGLTRKRVIHRAGASGTTFAFTQHPGAVGEALKKRRDVGLTARWPTGVGAKGTDGVAETIQKTPGAIGYLDFGYAQYGKVAIAKLQNRAGENVAPSVKSNQAALKSVVSPENLRAFVPSVATAQHCVRAPASCPGLLIVAELVRVHDLAAVARDDRTHGRFVKILLEPVNGTVREGGVDSLLE